MALGYKLAQGCPVGESSLEASLTFPDFLDASHDEGGQTPQQSGSSLPQTLVPLPGVQFGSRDPWDASRAAILYFQVLQDFGNPAGVNGPDPSLDSSPFPREQPKRQVLYERVSCEPRGSAGPH